MWENTENFKVFYRKQLLQYVLVKIKPESKASHVINKAYWRDNDHLEKSLKNDCQFFF